MERYRMLRKIAFWLLFVAWLVALEVPMPKVVTEELGDWWSFIVAKSMHFGVFAFLTCLGLSFPRTAKGRWLALGVVSALAFGSEALQYLLSDWCHRTGKWKDVGLDHIGIAIGAGVWLLLQRWPWTRRMTS